jgi:hypothetical protein
MIHTSNKFHRFFPSMVKKIDGLFSKAPGISRHKSKLKKTPATMATFNIPNTPNYANLISIIEDIMNPSAKQMRTFQEKLNESELALLFSAVEGNCSTSGNKKAARSAASPKVAKAPRNQSKPADEAVRCEALVFAYELSSDGTIVPARCKRCIEEDTKFCKQHGAADGKPWKCKERGDLETVHDFKWQHLGTVHDPSPIFELTKAKDELMKNFNAKQSGGSAHSSDGSDDESKVTKKAPKEKKTAEKKATKEKKTAEKKADQAPKRRVANGYIFYKSLKHQEIKEQLMAENPEMKGKELANKITSVASEQWKLLSDVDQAEYKQQAKDAIAAKGDELADQVESHSDEGEDTPLASTNTPKASASEIANEMDGESQIEIPSVDSGNEDEEETIVFNAKHGVWVDTDNNLCYTTKDITPGPIGQVQRGQFLRFPVAKK